MVEESKKTTGKLRKYNERLFAVFGTLAVAGLLFLGVVIAYQIAPGIFGLMRDDPGQLITNEEAQEAAEKGLRLQAASFQLAERLFKKEPYYVIQVGQRTLREPESSAKVNQFFSGPRHPYWQDTNNLIVWNHKTGETQLVLPERVRISGRKGYLERSEPYLLVHTQRISIDEKTEGLRISDWALWVYRLEDGSRTKIEIPGKVVRQIGTLNDSELAYALIGEDRNGDGIFDQKREPTLVYRINAEAGTLSSVVPDAIRVEVQNILDGMPDEAE